MAATDHVSYVELRAHTAFSFGSGAVTPEALVTRAADLEYSSIGITDTADLGGIVRFAMEARRQNIRPIVGVELNVDGYPAAFLARTAEGYRNIAALVTRARSGNADNNAGAPLRGRPKVTWRDVTARSTGLHALTGPASGEIASLLCKNQHDKAARALERWRDVFGERLAIEVGLHQAGRREEALAGALIELAERARVPWVVANDPRYTDRAGRLAHDILTALSADLDLKTAAERGVLLPNGNWKLESPARMATRWTGREAGLDESVRIASECDFSLSWVRPPLPNFPIPERHTVDSYLRECAYAGAHDRWGGTLSEAQCAQLEHELDVIQRLGFSGFFLVMWDAVRYAHTSGILCQGRGSAANSAVAYCLGITAVDPVRHGLLFERFLSAVRVGGETEAPDIDVDIEHDRREQVLDYVYGKYDRSHAAITCIVQTYRAPNAVQDVMRAFGFPADLAVSLSKRLHDHDPAGGAARLKEGLAAEFGVDVEGPRGRALLSAIAALDGLPRLRATHPGGFVLSSEALGDYVPIEPTTMGRTILQFDKDDLDAVGIPKFDFLGLGALAQVRRAFDAIEVRTGVRPSLYGLPPDDPETFRTISEGDTIGMFQIESRAQIASLVHTRPDRLYDLVVQVALIRPGPIQARFVHPYTRRRRGQERITYAHPALEPILARTQGIPIFQEQAMAIGMALAGYTASEADELRRTMGNHRKLAKLTAALERLRERMESRGISSATAAEIVEDLKSFANYGFPESHAWSFALIAYATAYLKTHYPAEFYAGILNAWPMGFYSPATLVHDARRHGVEVRAPCLRDGMRDCTVEETRGTGKSPEVATLVGPALRIGWRHIRGIGEHTLDALEAAQHDTRFSSIRDVVHRARLTRTDAAALARGRAFAAWQTDRRRAAWEALRVAGDILPLAPAWREETGQDSGGFADGFNPRALGRDEEIALDYCAVGLSTAGHPMERYREWLGRMGAIGCAELAAYGGGERVIVAGLVTVRQRPQSAKGTIFLLLEDEQGSVNVIVWKKLAEEHREAVRHANFLAVYGRVERDGAQVSVIAQRFRALDGLDMSLDLAHHSRDFH